MAARITSYTAKGIRRPTLTAYSSFVRATSCSFSSSRCAEARDHYRVLGVPPNASPKEIKAAYFRRAKQLHPDVAGSRARHEGEGNGEGEADAAAFVELSISYEVLSNPSERARFDAERFSAGDAQAASGRWGRSSSAAGSAADGDEASSSDVAPSFEEDPSRMWGGLGGISRRAYEQGEQSLWAKLRDAHHGPQFHGSSADFPYAFELDERNDASCSHDILRLVLGQRLLGVVRGRTTEMIGDGGHDRHRRGQLPSWLPSLESASNRDSAAGSEDAAGPASTSPAPSQSSSYSSLEFWFLGKHLATARVLPKSAVPDAQQAAAEGAEPSSEGAENPYRSMVIAIYPGKDAAKCVLKPDNSGDDDDHSDTAPSPEEAIFGEFDPSAASYTDEQQLKPVAYILPGEGLRELYMRRVVVCSLVERSEEMKREARNQDAAERADKGEAEAKANGPQEQRGPPEAFAEGPSARASSFRDAAPTQKSSTAATDANAETEREELEQLFPHLRDTGHHRHRRLGFGQAYRPKHPSSATGAGEPSEAESASSFFGSLFNDEHAKPNASSDRSNTGSKSNDQRLYQSSGARVKAAGNVPPWAAPHWNQSRPWRSIGDGSGADVPSFRMSPLSSNSGSSGKESAQHPYARAECATHTLIVYRTPGISHLRWMRNFDMALEAKGSRVRLPGSQYWLWDASSPHHQHGGFYFELSRRRKVEWWKKKSNNAVGSPIDSVSHPALYVLTAAVMTLEREWEREMKLSEKTLVGGARRLWDRLGRGLGKGE